TRRGSRQVARAKRVGSIELSGGESLSPRSYLIAARHPQHVLADVGEDEVVVDRRRLVEAALAELPLDVVLLGVTVAAVAVDTGVAGLPCCLGAEVLRHVGLAAARLPGVEERGRPVA